MAVLGAQAGVKLSANRVGASGLNALSPPGAQRQESVASSAASRHQASCPARTRPRYARIFASRRHQRRHDERKGYRPGAEKTKTSSKGVLTTGGDYGKRTVGRRLHPELRTRPAKPVVTFTGGVD
jgi:hypothetical protein